MPQQGIVFRAVIYGGSGFAADNLDILAALQDNGLPVQLVPVGQDRDRNHLLHPARRLELERLQQRRFDVSQSILYQCAAPPSLDLNIPARFRIGRTTFETDSLPRGWAARCNALDEIWVPSTFNRESFLRAGVHEGRLRVMPEGLDTSRFRPGLKALPIPGRRGFNFLSVFDWGDRKGPDVLLRAWGQAFHADDDVTLVLKVHNINLPGLDLEEHVVYLLERELGLRLEQIAPILLLRGQLPARDMPRLYASADAFVLPTRGEGWGRPFMEAAACQLPVLATRWSGQLDFLNDGNSFLIDLDAVAPVREDTDAEIFLGQCWAEPSVEHLAQLLRTVFEHRDQARAKAQQARHDMVTHWDRSVLAPQWAQAFRALLN